MKGKAGNLLEYDWNLSAQDILSCAKEVLSCEAQAIHQAVHVLDTTFISAVRAIASIPYGSRVVVSGMGKAGIVGMKISATFASTGTPSFFLHPAEAIHGDLGRYTKGDIALVLSNSGETPEVTGMLKVVKRMGCKIISLTESRDSTLGQNSDITIAIGKLREACPLGLAPTTSAVTMMSIGDALAMCVLREKGFSREEFAKFHPGGSLGKRLMRVREIMRANEELAKAKDTTKLIDLLKIITATKGRPGAAALLGEDGKLSGIFTDGDLRRCLERGSECLNMPVKNFMGKNPKVVKPDSLVETALNIMEQYKIDQVVVVNEDNEPIGMLDIQDVLPIK